MQTLLVGQRLIPLIVAREGQPLLDLRLGEVRGQLYVNGHLRAVFRARKRRGDL